MLVQAIFSHLFFLIYSHINWRFHYRHINLTPWETSGSQSFFFPVSTVFMMSPTPYSYFGNKKQIEAKSPEITSYKYGTPIPIICCKSFGSFVDKKSVRPQTDKRHSGWSLKTANLISMTNPRPKPVTKRPSASK